MIIYHLTTYRNYFEVKTHFKRYTKSKFTCIVSVYLDKEYKYDHIDEVPSEVEKIVCHEFEDFSFADEYCKLLLEMNQDYLGRFLYKIRYLPIEMSPNFTNVIEFYPFNNN